jgi:hypothetical protein
LLLAREVGRNSEETSPAGVKRLRNSLKALMSGREIFRVADAGSCAGCSMRMVKVGGRTGSWAKRSWRSEGMTFRGLGTRWIRYGWRGNPDMRCERAALGTGTRKEWTRMRGLGLGPSIRNEGLRFFDSIEKEKSACPRVAAQSSFEEPYLV